MAKKTANIDSCKLCVDNNHGWCNRYKAQKPVAIIECMNKKEEKKENINKKYKKIAENCVTIKDKLDFTDEEIDAIAHALTFTSKHYYDSEIQKIECLISDNDENPNLHNQNIIDVCTKLLDQYIREQEILTNILKKIRKGE